MVIVLTGLFSGIDDRNNDQASGWSPLISPDMTKNKNVFPKVNQSHILPGITKNVVHSVVAVHKASPKQFVLYISTIKPIVFVTCARSFFFPFLCKIFNLSLPGLMIPYPTGKSTTWNAPKCLLSKNKKAVKEMRQFGYSESTNVLQCLILCADMWQGKDRQTDR